MKRIYLDYNATAPLAKSFVNALASGEVPFENASAVHSSAKSVTKKLRDVESFLFSTFKLNSSDFHLLYHSGATEAANTFFQLRQTDALVYFQSDHDCLKQVARKLRESGISCKELTLDSSGRPCVAKVIDEIKQLQTLGKNVYFHFTRMLSETGHVWPLDLALEIKRATGCIIYVDSVQCIGKQDADLALEKDLDVYTFSGHKFGALKGIGFSFIRKDLSYTPLILGGGQQEGRRSGTLNSHGIFSLEYALKEQLQVDKDGLIKLKNEICEKLASSQAIEVIKSESYNTISFTHHKLHSDMMLIHFDMLGLDVSAGSACSAGSFVASDTLLAMGHGERAKNIIRLSIGSASLSEGEEILSRLDSVLKKL